VPKGEDDIHLVYNGSVSGLNITLWVPCFFLPTIRTHLRAVEENTFMVDLDIGEMFLNFILHKDLLALAGVDLSHYFEDEKYGPLWEAWHRPAMGLRLLPFQCVQAMGVAEEVIRGDPFCPPPNIFCWDTVELKQKQKQKSRSTYLALSRTTRTGIEPRFLAPVRARIVGPTESEVANGLGTLTFYSTV
jgi:hypothetical protein